MDLRKIEPKWTPPNARFEVANIEDTWNFPPNHFGYIHARDIGRSIRDWPALLRKIYHHTKPGGWTEIIIPEVGIESDDGTVPENAHIRTFYAKMEEGLAKLGYPSLTDDGLRKKLNDQGFVDVVKITVKQPWGAWPRDVKLREAGAMAYFALDGHFKTWSLPLLVEGAGMSEQAANELWERALADLRNKDMHSYRTVSHVYGRKPEYIATGRL
jgi:hypothetical protein